MTAVPCVVMVRTSGSVEEEKVVRVPLVEMLTVSFMVLDENACTVPSVSAV